MVRNLSIPNSYFDVQKLPVTDNGFKVVIKQKLDREVLDAHLVRIICHDYGTPRLSAEASFNVTVSDDNDNDPKFLKILYEAYVDENTKLGYPIVQALQHRQFPQKANLSSQRDDCCQHPRHSQ
jgi:hypothetical protein